MPNKSDALERERSQRLPENRVPPREEVHAALLRLREIGEQLPPVDAVAVIREGRDLTPQGHR